MDLNLSIRKIGVSLIKMQFIFHLTSLLEDPKLQVYLLRRKIYFIIKSLLDLEVESFFTWMNKAMNIFPT